MSQPQDGPSPNVGGLEEARHELIVEHYRKPRNRHFLTDPDIQTTEVNPFCGDEITIQVRINVYLCITYVNDADSKRIVYSIAFWVCAGFWITCDGVA